MFTQFIKTSCRIFFKERIYSILNIIGLSTGITVALVIFIYLQDELTYDRYNVNARNIYRVNSIYVSSGKENKFALSPESVGPRIIEEYPEVKAFTRILRLQKGKLSYGDKSFYEENLVVADSSFFNIFTARFILGGPATCFNSPNSIVITEKLASKYFGSGDPMGKIFILDKTQTFEVTGLIKDPPGNLHLKYDALIPVKRYDPEGSSVNSTFFDVNLFTYLLLPENYDTKQFYDKFPAFYEKYAAQTGKALSQEYKAVIQPLLDIHFSKEWAYDLPNGNKTYIIAFLIIGVLVLSLSCINYLNLTTARAEKRIKEICIKKALGSKSFGILLQFLGESMLMSVVSMLLALLMTWLILEFTSFDQLISRDLNFGFANNPLLVGGIIGLTLITGLASGTYPAFYLSNIHPLKSLKKINRTGVFDFSLRKLLVIIQLTISIGVVIFTLLIDHQIEYVRKKDIGINKENIMILPIRDTAMIRHIDSMKDMLLQNPSIQKVSTAYQMPAGGVKNNLYRAEADSGMEENNFNSMFVSYGFLSILGIKLLEGRDFSREFPTDFRSSFIINETLAKKMGWKEPVGKRLQQNFEPDGKPYFDGVVIGVVNDFNYNSLHNVIDPLVIRLQGSDAGHLLIKLNGKDIESSIDFIEKVWNEYSDEFPEDYTFMEKNFELQYRKDREQNMLVKTFSWICIVISVLGLLSLASYITRNRTREIAIRKVYGASVCNLIMMLYREIIVLVIFSAVLAIPLACWLAKKILSGSFAYLAGFNINIFLFTVTGAIVIVLLTVSYHSVKAAFVNPAGSLKYE